MRIEKLKKQVNLSTLFCMFNSVLKMVRRKKKTKQEKISVHETLTKCGDVSNFEGVL